MSFDFSYEIRGTNRVRNQLRTAASFWPEKADPTIRKHVGGEAARLRSKSYPPLLPRQMYVRTYNLKRRWGFNRKKAGVYNVVNTASYAAWVIQRGMQNRKYHRGRWWTGEEELGKNMPKLTRILSERLEELMRRES